MFKRTLTAVILSVLTAFSYAGADSYLHDHPAKISIIVDTSNSMLGVDGSTLKQKSVIVREALGQNAGDMIDIAGMDLWHFGGRNNPACQPGRVYNADRGDTAVVDAVRSLKGLQAGNMLAVNEAKNPIYRSLIAAANGGSGGIMLITDSAEDCDMAPRAVCQAAGEIGIPVYVLSLATTRQARIDLECLSNISHGSFAHAASGQEIAPLMKTLLRVAISRAQISIAERLLLSMNDQIKELVDENQTLWSENAQLMQTNGELAQRVEGLLIMVGERDAEIAAQAATIDELRDTVGALEDENAALRATVAQLEQHVEDLQRLVEELKLMIAHLEAEAVESAATIAALHGAVEELTAENTALREKIAMLTEALEAARNEIAVLTSHVGKLVQERDALQGEVDEKAQEIADLRVSLEACLSEKQAMSDIIDGQGNDINELQQTVITATKNCESRVLTVERNERDQCTAQMTQLQTSCQKQEANLLDQIGDLEASISEKDASIKALHGAVAERDNKVDGLIAERESILTANAELRQMVSEQENIIVGLHMSVQQLGSNLDACHGELQMCRIEYGDLDSRFNVITDENIELTEKIAEYDDLLKSCKSQLGDAIIEADRLRRVDRENTDLRAKLATKTAQLNACEADKAAFRIGLSPLVVDHLETPSTTSD